MLHVHLTLKHLNHKALIKIIADDILKFFRENKSCHFTQIVCYANESHEMSSFIFSKITHTKKNKKKKQQQQIVICCSCDHHENIPI